MRECRVRVVFQEVLQVAVDAVEIRACRKDVERAAQPAVLIE
jgi:hypothetical protein